MWALGVVIHVMATGTFPWSLKNMASVANEITSGAFTVSMAISLNIRALVQALLAPDPTARPSAESVLALPWVSAAATPMNPVSIRAKKRMDSASGVFAVRRGPKLTTGIRAVQSTFVIHPRIHTFGVEPSSPLT
jgi:serine/threonine protein kinase